MPISIGLTTIKVSYVIGALAVEIGEPQMCWVGTFNTIRVVQSGNYLLTDPKYNHRIQ